jgi:hypothetical protein
MLRRLILAAGVALALLAPAYAADPQKFGDEAKATAFCKTGNVVWFNPASKIYFDPGSQFTARPRAAASLAARSPTSRGLGPAKETERRTDDLV